MLIPIDRFDLELSASSMEKKSFIINWHRSNCTVNSLLLFFFFREIDVQSYLGTRLFEDEMCIKSGDDGKRMMMMSFRVNPLTLIRLPAARKLARAKEVSPSFIEKQTTSFRLRE